jgi:hypothetical protein
MRQGGSDDLDRADEVCIDLMSDLIVGEFLGGAEKTVARVIDDHVDAAECAKRFADDAVDGGHVGHVKQGEPELVAVLRF